MKSITDYVNINEDDKGLVDEVKYARDQFAQLDAVINGLEQVFKELGYNKRKSADCIKVLRKYNDDSIEMIDHIYKECGGKY